MSHNCQAVCFFTFLFCGLHYCSSYPSPRVEKDSKGVKMGVIGSVSLVQNAVLSSQPVSSFDWHPDKVSMQCVCECGVCGVVCVCVSVVCV